MKRPEQQFQIKLVRDLALILTAQTFWTHFPAGGGGAKRGAFLKAMGLKSGVPDLLFIHNGQAYWMELKAPGRSLSIAQIACKLNLRLTGSHVETVKSLDEALECLALWNIPTRLKQPKAAA